MTIREAITGTATALLEAGVDSPRLDAELLVAHVLGWDRRRLATYPATVLAEKAVRELDSLRERRCRREPLAYILGEWEFYGRAFTVTPAVLVPRPETEMLVEAALAWLRTREAVTIADVGTGSGAIAVTIAAEAPSLHVIALDVSAEALAVARGNARRHGVDERVDFRQGDLLAPLAGERVSAILANLPYVTESDYGLLMPEVSDYEPALALRGGDDGLDIIRRLIVQAPHALLPGGLLGLEVGEGQAETVASLLRVDGWSDICVLNDYGGIARHVLATYSGG